MAMIGASLLKSDEKWSRSRAGAADRPLVAEDWFQSRKPTKLVGVKAISSPEYRRRKGGPRSKQRLIDLVEALDEEQTAEAIDLLEERFAEPPRARRLPKFVGMGHSGHGELGRRAKDIIRAELGGHGE